MSDLSWYFAQNNQQQGPVPLAELQRKLAAGELGLNALVWTEGMPQWVQAGTLPVLAPAGGATWAAMPPAAPGGVIEYQTPLVPHPYAGFWLRFLAYLLDYLLIWIAQTILLAGAWGLGFFVLAGHPPSRAYLHLAQPIVLWIGIWLYFGLMESSAWQGTVGKQLVGLKVTDLNGRRIGFGQAMGRNLGKVLSAFILMIGFIMAGFTERKQALHDLLAKTLIVRK